MGHKERPTKRVCTVASIEISLFKLQIKKFCNRTDEGWSQFAGTRLFVRIWLRGNDEMKISFDKTLQESLLLEINKFKFNSVSLTQKNTLCSKKEITLSYYYFQQPDFDNLVDFDFRLLQQGPTFA